jgi:serine protease Do
VREAGKAEKMGDRTKSAGFPSLPPVRRFLSRGFPASCFLLPDEIIMLKSSSLILLVISLLVLPARAHDPDAPPAPGYGEVSGSYMGIDMQEVTHDRMVALRLTEERGAEITMVDHESPAGQAGLKEHDVILEFNGTMIQGTEELRRMIHETPPGRTVQLVISRDGQPMNISLTLADKKTYFAGKQHEWHDIPPTPPMPPMPPMPAMPQVEVNVHTGSTYGLVVDNLTPQLGDYFGVKNGEGVLVKSVEEGTPGKAAGFKAGDVIVRVNNQKVADRGDWRSALRGSRSAKLTVGIVRDHREQNLTISLPETSRNHSALRVSPSVEDLDLDLDLNLGLDELRSDLAELRPELEHAQSMAMEEARQALKDSRKQLDLNEKELHRAIDEAKKSLDRAMKDWQKQLDEVQKSKPPQD